MYDANKYTVIIAEALVEKIEYLKIELEQANDYIQGLRYEHETDNSVRVKYYLMNALDDILDVLNDGSSELSVAKIKSVRDIVREAQEQVLLDSESYFND